MLTPRLFSLGAIPLAMALAAGCGMDVGAHLVMAGSTAQDQRLTVKPGRVWRQPELRVCYSFAGFEVEKRWVQAAVTRTWGTYLPLDFTGFGPCPRGNDGKDVPHVVVSINDDARSGPHVEWLGQIDGLSHVVLNFTFQDWGRQWPTTAGSRQQAIEAIAVHEFGHVLGFGHEHNRPDTDRNNCRQAPQGEIAGAALSPWDPESVMNYCSGRHLPSARDITGAQAIYGIRDDLFFDADFYRHSHADLDAAGLDAAAGRAHFVARGAAEGRAGAPWFDASWYAARYATGTAREVASSGEPSWDVVRNFAGEGMAAGRSGSALWDPCFYLAQNPDVAAWAGAGNYAAALAHWRNHGIDEGRAGSAEFSAVAYLRRYPDVAAAVGAANYRDAIAHFVRFGRGEGRSGRP